MIVTFQFSYYGSRWLCCKNSLLKLGFIEIPKCFWELLQLTQSNTLFRNVFSPIPMHAHTQVSYYSCACWYRKAMRSFSTPRFAKAGCICWVGIKINVALSGTNVISNTAYFSPGASSFCSHKSTETHINMSRGTHWGENRISCLLTDFLPWQEGNVFLRSILRACTAPSCHAGRSGAFPHHPAPVPNALGMQQIAAVEARCSQPQLQQLPSKLHPPGQEMWHLGWTKEGGSG